MKKLAVLAMTGILALTAVGFGFAKWSSQVDANVTVNTGSVLIGIKDLGTNDDNSNVVVADLPIGPTQPNAGQPGADPQWGDGINDEGKDVAKLVSDNEPTVCQPITGTDYYTAITESITNGYPWYGPTTEVDVKNLGTIPVKLESFAWTWDTAAPGLTNLDPWFEVASYEISMDGMATKTGSGKANFQGALDKIQLHAGDVLHVKLQFGLREIKEGEQTQTALNVLPQKANGRATFHVTATQWNEVK